MKKCFCGSTLSYQICCQPYHKHVKYPDDSLVLMKSRYSAYALSLVDYIIETTDPQSSIYRLDHQSWKHQMLIFCSTTTFKQLEILDYIPGAHMAFVIFIAYLSQHNCDATFTEKSTFIRRDNLWLYHDGKTKRGVSTKERFL